MQRILDCYFSPLNCWLDAINMAFMGEKFNETVTFYDSLTWVKFQMHSSVQPFLAVLPKGRNIARKTQNGPKLWAWGRENLGPKL
jgi:hypothetical protein